MSIMSPSTNETSTIVSVWFCPAVPTLALPPNPSLLWQLLPGPRNMPPGAFFFWAPTFLLIASVPCGATVRTLPETSSQVMPAAHCHISSSPDYSSTAHERWREGGCLGLQLFQETKGEELWALLLSKNFPSVAFKKKKRTQGNCQEQKVRKKRQHVKWMI